MIFKTLNSLLMIYICSSCVFRCGRFYLCIHILSVFSALIVIWVRDFDSSPLISDEFLMSNQSRIMHFIALEVALHILFMQYIMPSVLC